MPGVQGRMSIARCESRPRVGYGSRGTKMWGVGGGGVGKGGWRGWVGGGDTERKQGFHETPPPPYMYKKKKKIRDIGASKGDGGGERMRVGMKVVIGMILGVCVCVTPGMTPG